MLRHKNPAALAGQRGVSVLNIRDVKHLTFKLGLTPIQLDKISSNTLKFYRPKTIETAGKQRQLNIPIGQLRRIQNRLNLLLQSEDLPDNMHGGIPNRSPFTYVSKHVGKKTQIKSDIRDCFPTISNMRVYGLFIELGCSPDVARYLTKLTTVNGSIPQGSPTSTVIANLATKKLANRLNGLAKSYGQAVNADTFVDDIVLSGPPHVTKSFKTVLKIIEQEGFQPNTKKTKIQMKGDLHILAGIRTDKKVIDVQPDKLIEVNQMIQRIKKDVLQGLLPSSKVINSIKGKIRYVTRLNRGAGNQLLRKLKKEYLYLNPS